jgi:CRISPR-associated protein Cas1
MTNDGRKRFLQQYEDRRSTEFTHPVLHRKMTYRQSFEQQARQLAKVLQGDLDGYVPLTLQ